MTRSEQPSPRNKTNNEFEQLLSTLLNQRRLGSKNGSAAQQVAWRRKRAALRRGSSPHTESYAYPYVLPYITDVTSPSKRSVAIQLAALIAEFEKIPILESSKDPHKKNEWRDFGTWCNLVSRAIAAERGINFELDPDKDDIIAHRLRYLETLDATSAIASVRRIMVIASRLPNPPAINYRDLFCTFFYWGKGFTANSLNVRRRPLQSYYSAVTPQAPGDKPSTSEK